MSTAGKELCCTITLAQNMFTSKTYKEGQQENEEYV